MTIPRRKYRSQVAGASSPVASERLRGYLALEVFEHSTDSHLRILTKIFVADGSRFQVQLFPDI